MGGCQRKRALMRKRHRVRKRRAEREKDHTVVRAEERFRVKLTDGDYQRLTNQIKRRKVRFLGNRSDNASLYEVRLPDGRKAIALFDNKTRTIATILHPAWCGLTTK